jgi:hypothetical protein
MASEAEAAPAWEEEAGLASEAEAAWEEAAAQTGFDDSMVDASFWPGRVGGLEPLGGGEKQM